jgi:hypothetical protein
MKCEAQYGHDEIVEPRDLAAKARQRLEDPPSRQVCGIPMTVAEAVPSERGSWSSVQEALGDPHKHTAAAPSFSRKDSVSSHGGSRGAN